MLPIPEQLYSKPPDAVLRVHQYLGAGGEEMTQADLLEDKDRIPEGR